MTPRERAEALFAKMSAAAAREYVRALLADDEATVEAMVAVGLNWKDPRAQARAALAALRRNAGVE
jgi:hypothetical protein